MTGEAREQGWMVLAVLAFVLGFWLGLTADREPHERIAFQTTDPPPTSEMTIEWGDPFDAVAWDI